MENVVMDEGSLPTEPRPEPTEKTTTAKLLFAMTGLYERWRDEMMMETRRYRDPSESDPNYGERLRELEGQIAEIDREQQGSRMQGNYTEGGNREPSWKDWVLGLVGLAIVAWLSRISLQLDDLSDLKAQQKQMDRHLDQTDKHLEATDQHLDRVDARIYRGSP
jgi:hypothetical protein